MCADDLIKKIPKSTWFNVCACIAGMYRNDESLYTVNIQSFLFSP